MRKVIFIFISLFCHLAIAQYPLDNKRDHVWMLGYENAPPEFGGTCLNFNQSPIQISYASQQINMDGTNASICDSSGNILFYTNGMYVANANHTIMPNGDTLNPGAVFNWFEDYGYRMPQGAIIFPLPGSENIYYILHEKLDFMQNLFMLPSGVYFSVVDMNLDNGLGDVLQKNVPLLLDTLDFGCITATRHANGRDWWIIIPKFGINKYYRILLTPTGFFVDSLQTIGTGSNVAELGMACLSPDGTKYVRWAGTSVNHPNRLEVFDFNRCTGMLLNYQNLWYTDTAWAFGVAISPNSQFMYVSADKRIDQYYLNSTDIASTRQVVAIYDGFTDPQFSWSQTRFFLEQLGPDNKIYINCPGSTRFLSVISQPDNEGIASNVIQHAIQLSTFNNASIPTFPNFRLGPIDGSICDSLGINIITSIPNELKKDILFSIWPNPANDFINYKIEAHSDQVSYRLCIIDNLGRKVRDREINSWQTIGHFDVGDLQQGFYQVTLKKENCNVFIGRKLLIIKQ